jgi:hypothetical protein
MLTAIVVLVDSGHDVNESVLAVAIEESKTKVLVASG